MNEKKLMESAEGAVTLLRSLYGRYGYSQYRMRKFEEYDLYVRNKNFLVSDHIITFTEPGGKLMALRPDVTLSIVKNAKDTPGYVQKVYYKENVYRADKDSGEFREITQVGLECVGDIDTYQISEVLWLALESLAAIGGDFVLDISHLGLVSAVLQEAGVPAEMHRTLLACIGEKNAHEAAALCEKAGLPAQKTADVLKLVTTYGEAETVLPVLETIGLGETGRAALAELRAVLSVFQDKVPRGSIRLDFSVINDMNYYNGIVFRGFVCGIPAGILSGGQYDYLLQKMGKKAGAIGFAVYPALLEGRSALAEEYDVDTVLLYGEEDDLSALHEAVLALQAEGKSVAAHKSLPAKMTYRQVCRLGKNGVEKV